MKNENTASRPFRGIYDGTVQVPSRSQPKVASIGDDAQFRKLLADIFEDTDLSSDKARRYTNLIVEAVDRRTAQHQPPAVQADSVAVAEAKVISMTPGMARIELQFSGQVPEWAEVGYTVQIAAQSADKPSVSAREKALEEALRDMLALQPLANDGLTGEQIVTNADIEVCRKARRALAVSASADGSGPMPVTQEPKYGIRNNRLFNRASGEFIPADEPVFIFRARDYKACAALQGYMSMFGPVPHRAAIEGRVKDFRIFSQDFPERMKEPDTQTGGSEGN